ncbi:hypothetical protein [Streptomyces anulatus]|uniref:hypothetical protein n=1 Tax=Streptomyces anulatus TaxID=1892 RepID=UPI0034131CD3
MAAPTLPHLSPAQRERLERADAARLRTALFPSPKSMPRRRVRSPQPAEPVAHRAGPPLGMNGQGDFRVLGV